MSHDTRPCCFLFHVTISVWRHGRVEQTHGRVSFTETVPTLNTPVFPHPFASNSAHARVFSPHGRVSLQKSPCLGFPCAINSHYAPWWQTSIISFKIHQICSNHSSKYVEFLCKLSVYQRPLPQKSSTQQRGSRPELRRSIQDFRSINPRCISISLFEWRSNL